MIYVLDACALIAMLNAEEGAKKVETVFEQAFEGNATIAMSIVNLLEVYITDMFGLKVNKKR